MELSENCPECDGLAFREGCALCKGKARVSTALLRVYEANKWASENLDWKGVPTPDITRGIPQYSMAMWLRRRGEFSVELVMASRVNGLPQVVLHGATRKELVLDGVEWGYAGGGPSALAAILADALPNRFASEAEAKAWVGSRPSGGWVLMPAPAA